MKRKYSLKLFLFGFITNILFRFFWLFVPGVILLIVGIFIDRCSYIGFVLLGIDIVISFVDQMKIRRTMLSESDNEQFRNFQDVISKEGDVVKNIMDYLEGRIDKDDPVAAVYNTVCEKCKYGNDFEKLNEHEKILFTTQTAEQEINNGGFHQFFYNSSGNSVNNLVDSFEKIGAVKTAEICKKALSVFNGEIPVDRKERQKLLDKLNCDDLLGDCDNAFYNYEDDLETLNYSYIMKYREFFD